MNSNTPIISNPEDGAPMGPAKKFLFETSFDVEELPLETVEDEAEEVEPEEIIPTFSEEEVTAAREEGFATGKEEGINEASAATERQIVGLLNTLMEHFKELFNAQEKADSSILDSAISVAVAIARKAFPTLNERHGMEEIERMVDIALKNILDEPQVTLYTSPDLADTLSKRLGALTTQAGFKGKIQVLADETISAGDCRAEWSGGGAKRNMDELWQEIDEIVERNLSGKPVTTALTENTDEPVDGSAIGDMELDPEDAILSPEEDEAPATDMATSPSPEEAPDMSPETDPDPQAITPDDAPDTSLDEPGDEDTQPDPEDI